MKIGIDMKPFNTGSQYRGIGMYSRALIEELLISKENFEFHFLNLYEKYDGDPCMNDRCHLYQYNLGPKIVDVGERQLFRDPRTMDVIEGAVKHFIEKSNIDVMLFTSPNEYGNMYRAEWFEGVYKVGILYDLIPLMFPEQCLFDPTYADDYKKSLEFLKELDLLLAISQSAKDDAVKLLGIPENKIVVIYAGIDKKYRKLERVDLSDLKHRLGFSDAFIMFAGGIDFKKNIEGLITAYAHCGSKFTNRYQLLIVGKMSQDVEQHYRQIAKENNVEGRVICTGFVSQDDLIALYNTTDLLVFPSLYEGFGLPVIEAMACGARVVTSNCSSLKEISEGYATLVSPGSIKSITKGILKVFDHPVDSLKLADKAIKYAELFTWQRVAERTIKVILQNYEPSTPKVYSFHITEEIVRNIARLYAERALSFNIEDRREIAEELIDIEKHNDRVLFNVKNRLLYDVTVVHEWIKANYSTGIGRVSKELFKELTKRLRVVPVVVSNEKGHFICEEISLETFEIKGELKDLGKDDVFFMPEIQIRGVQVSKKHPYVKLLRQQGIKAYSVIYDILPLRMPQYFEKETVKRFAPYIKEIVTNYDGILCDSKFVADDLINYCREKNINSDQKVRVGYFHLGQDTFEKKLENVSMAVKNFFSSGNRVYIMIGTIEPRKGHEIVLKAFDKLWRDGSNNKLCIIGHIGWNMDEFITSMKRHPQMGNKLAFFEGPSDGEVRYAYENAAALIQASAGEGFGLPLIVASNYNVPIICSELEVFHEVAGDNANYFDRNDSEALVQAIKKFEDGEGVYESKGIEKISWKSAADRVYSMIINDSEWYSEIV